MSELAENSVSISSEPFSLPKLPATDEDISEEDDGQARTITDYLEDHTRWQKKAEKVDVKEFEVRDEDRRSEILHRIRDLTELEDDDWMEPGNGTVNVDWDELREAGTDRRTLGNLESKYGSNGQLMKITVDTPEEMPFQPGDAFSIKLPETPDIDVENYDVPEVCDPEKETKYNVYSVGSSPDADELEFYILRIPDEAATRTSMTPVIEAKMEEMDNPEIMLKGPENDELEMLEESDRDLVYVSTGTGMAPTKSMVQALERNDMDGYEGQKRDIFIFSATKFRDQLPAHNYFEELDEENHNIHYIPILSREESLNDWEGETGHAQQVVRKYISGNRGLTENQVPARIDPENAEVYGCGNGLMIEGLDRVIKEEGFDEKFYQTEAFF